MDLFTRDDLTTLLDQPQSDTVSLYLPTHRAGPEAQQEAIRLNNLIRRATEDLLGRGMGRREARELLQPARSLIGDVAFWRRASDGVAAFFRAGWWRAYRLPMAFDELAVVSDRCHVVPLLPLLARDGRFYLLALSEHDARLLAATRTGAHPVAVPAMPHGVAEPPHHDEPHLHSAGADARKEHLSRYLHDVDRAVATVLRGQDAPLVLAGVGQIRAAFRDITTYPHVPDAGVAGNPDRMPDADLHAAAWPLVADTFVHGKNDAAAAYEKALGTGMTCDDLAEAAAAAEAHRVEVLFLPATAPASAAELREAAAVHTIRAGGAVYVVPATDLPGTGSVAAILRH